MKKKTTVSNVLIKQLDPEAGVTNNYELFLDGVLIPGIVSVTFKVGTKSMPTVIIEAIANVVIHGEANVEQK